MVPHSNALRRQAGDKEQGYGPVSKLRWVEDYDFGAIAFSEPDSSWGISYHAASREAAETAALGYCTGSDPRVVIWGTRCWLALAKGAFHGVARAQDKRTAAQKALDSAEGSAIILTVFYTAK